MKNNPSIDYRQYLNADGSPSLILDCQCIVEQYQKLQAALPGVDLYYAMKALTHPAVIETMHQLGAGFDIATSGEIKLLRKAWVSPARTIHTHPIKSDREIKAALRYGCSTFVVDNPTELEKFMPYRHRVQLLLRLSFCNASAIVDLSKKFGCIPDQALWLLQKAKQLGITVKGLSFHIGSQNRDALKHASAIQVCQKIIVDAQELGINLSVLDIGGGFPISYDEKIADIHAYCAPLQSVLSELPRYVHVIAEPGRFLVAPAMTAVSQVVGKAMRSDKPWYYLNDGVYGSFSGVIYDHASYPIVAVGGKGEAVPSVLAGPTCDCIDVIHSDISLPTLEVGDILVGHLMGAYTLASASRFNSVPLPTVHVLPAVGLQARNQNSLRAVLQ